MARNFYIYGASIFSPYFGDDEMQNLIFHLIVKNKKKTVLFTETIKDDFQFSAKL